MSEAIDEILLKWLAETPGVPRRERQALLLKEILAVNTQRSLALHRDAELARISPTEDVDRVEGEEADIDALAERETKLCAALHSTLLEVVDVAEARRVAEYLCVSTDLNFLYGALDVCCVMSLRVMGDGSRQLAQQIRGVDDIINELSEFQESVLLLRVDSSTSPVRVNSSNHTVSHTIAVRGVSPVQSWVLRCEVEMEVGTQVTYYADAECTKALFDLRSSFLFSADGSKVEGISRDFLPRGGHRVDELLRDIHFGSFQS
ncbi:hypothetical protein ABL78_4381 [Leptomonas seymouri]|uniref:Uncharacterized protein n=1 Tax=Leptomonas seymouri TaxID=5684 RepID=A0A0N1I6I3_LEPSE|nr:hypothetical protein ABL78_4381 [Leptomonas seymouri]|eukprot:KPI86558.1 hypothetical protein ABL78_4381 [Leptomonas seymouri]